MGSGSSSTPKPWSKVRVGPIAPVAALLVVRCIEAGFSQLSLPCALCAAKPPSRSRALCLSCGACVCGPDTPHGPRACLAHARECGGGTALFLLTNSSGVLLVRDRRLMLLSSPYRDAHGEVDLGLLRGKPLTLAPAEYAALTRQWVALAFDEVQRGEDELMMF